MKRITSKLAAAAAAVALLALLAACARPEPKKPAENASDSRHTYKDIKPEVVAIPDAVAKALPGLQNDNLYLYREIAPTLNLVAYVPDYSRVAAVKMMAEAFTALANDPNPKLRDGIEFWIIQIQPEAKTEPAPKPGEQKSQVVVWGVRPSEADAYKQSKDLANFLAASEYLLVDDEIIPAGNGRMKPFPELASQGARDEGARDVSPDQPPPPSPGATVVPPPPPPTPPPAPNPGGTPP
jgi:hypothetical protein